MTAPAEDPRGGEGCEAFADCVVGNVSHHTHMDAEGRSWCCGSYPYTAHPAASGGATDGDRERLVILNERTRFGGETGAGLMRNRCAFTSRDMAGAWSDAFTYAVVYGWDGDDADDSAMDEMAARWGWDAAMVEFLRDAHRRFTALPDRTATTEDAT